jgi:hypothetical protein
MNTQGINTAADVIARAMQTRQTAAGIAVALAAAGMLQSPETAAEVERLRSQAALPDTIRTIAAELARRTLLADNCTCSDVLSAMAQDAATESCLWQHLANALNAIECLRIEPDGHISNPCGDEHIEWDRGAERWRLVHDDETLLTAEQAETRRLDYRARMRAAGGDLP